jgi:hypothetical protein
MCQMYCHVTVLETPVSWPGMPEPCKKPPVHPRAALAQAQALKLQARQEDSDRVGDEEPSLAQMPQGPLALCSIMQLSLTRAASLELCIFKFGRKSHIPLTTKITDNSHGGSRWL